jgi:Ca-activated chloride channel family protein
MLMKQLTALIVVFMLVSVAFSQSGRRVKTTPTPEVIKEQPPDQYSESKPTPKRIFPPSLIRETQSRDNTAANPDVSVPADDGDVIKVDTDLVTIPVSVYDRNGVYIPNLRQSDFKIFEDGIEQEIAYFGKTDVPFTVILLLDTSPSTEYKIDQIRDAARSFVDKLGPQDTVMVVEFAWNVHVLCEPTQDRQVISKAIGKADFGEGTSLYDAVDYALRKRMNQIKGRKAIVLFTDGVDTTSSKSSYDKTLAEAEESDSLIFPIYYNTYFDMRRQQGSVWPPIFGQPQINAPSASDYALGKKYLEDLAAYTGGRVFRPESGGLNAAFEGIAEELRRQYSIGYIPKDEGKPGQRKSIKVRVNMPNVAVRARDSYIVGAKRS